MRKYAGLIIFILLASVMAAGCASTDGSGVQDVKANENTPNTEDNTPKEQTTPPAKGSFNNPAAMGETVVLTSTGNTYEASVTDVTKGDQANYVVKSENEFNPDPASGYEYLLVKTKVAYTKGDSPTSISEFNFKAFCDGVECTSSYAVLPNNYIAFGTGDVMPGATKEGWIQYTVPTGKEVIISFQPNMFTESTAYISLGK